MKRSRLTILLAILLSVVTFWLVGNSRAATETPDYKVLRTDGKFEIRDYSSLTIATTPMKDGGVLQSEYALVTDAITSKKRFFPSSRPRMWLAAGRAAPGALSPRRCNRSRGDQTGAMLEF